MNINFSIFNEIISFIIFIIFSYILILPILTLNLNYYYLLYFKNKILNNLNKIFNIFFLNYIYKIEFYLNEKIIKNYLKFLKILISEKHMFKKYLITEKNNFILKIKNFFKKNNFFFLKNTINNFKKKFFKSFMIIYNSILNYNEEFIIYD